ncbi:uncharacterized protein TNIN_324251 [Trichonephila inaurata madagascariensis]|uniref:Uncharacterized protein n=1 Tax=Trichonephila inaurata madagascariensis TaxID=2747483 RepID=A0A8X6YKN6_9ARAC|nr:uncharacterized protein TNIN_324251 [Trichonephila inaurata madagascariensis]
MFRQIKLQEHQQDFLRILWRSSPEVDIVSYRLKTVTYGAKPAPYLATRCLLQLAHEGSPKIRGRTASIEGLENTSVHFTEGFCCSSTYRICADASSQAYGACLYVKSENANETQIRLLCSKTRVVPLKILSIPRLELLATTLLSKLATKIIKVIDLEFDEVHLFSDSKIVLDWIQTQPHLLKVFVANRVSLIQELTQTFSWHHVKTKDNPADLISRAATKLQLQDELWWAGPSFLKDKTLNSDSVVSQKDDNFFDRIVSYIFRFYFNCKYPASINSLVFLTGRSYKCFS